MIALIKCHFKAKIPGDSHKFNIASEIQPTAEITIIEFLTQIPTFGYWNELNETAESWNEY